MEIIDNLDRLRMTHSRLLYLIQEMHFMKRITIEEKLILKCIFSTHFNNLLNRDGIPRGEGFDVNSGGFQCAIDDDLPAAAGE